MKSYDSLKLICLFFMFIVWTSCGTTKSVEPQKSEVQSAKEDGIYFLVFRISKDAVKGGDNIELVSKVKAVGKLKNDHRDEIFSESYLKIEVVENDKLIETFFLEHPLYKSVEYYDDKRFVRKDVELKKEEFFIRIQTNNNFSNLIRISESIKKSAIKELITLKL